MKSIYRRAKTNETLFEIQELGCVLNNGGKQGAPLDDLITNR